MSARTILGRDLRVGDDLLDLSRRPQRVTRLEPYRPSNTDEARRLADLMGSARTAWIAGRDEPYTTVIDVSTVEIAS